MSNQEMILWAILIGWAIDKVAMYAIIKDAIVSAAKKLKGQDGNGDN